MEDEHIFDYDTFVRFPDDLEDDLYEEFDYDTFVRFPDDLEDDLYEETEEDRFYRTATLWQRICHIEPRYHQRILKYIHANLESYCCNFIGRDAVARQEGKPSPNTRFQQKVFYAASRAEYNLRPLVRRKT